MSQNKEILIGAKLDPQAGRSFTLLERGVKRVKEAFDQLGKASQAAMSGLTGARPGQQNADPRNSPIIKTFDQMARQQGLQSKAFKDTTREALGFGNVIKGIDADIAKLTRRIENFQSKAAGLRQIGTPGALAHASANDRQAARDQAQVGVLQGLQGGMTPAQAASRQAPAPPGVGGGGGGSSGGGGSGGGPAPAGGMSASEMAMLASTIGRSVAGAVGQAAGMFQQYKTMDSQNVSGGVQQVQGRLVSEMMGGYSPTMNFLRKYDKSALDPYLSTTAIKVGAVAQGVGSALQIGGGIAGMAGGAAGAGIGAGGLIRAGGGAGGAPGMIINGAQGIANPLMQATSQGFNAQAIGTAMKAIDAGIGMSPVESMGMQVLREEAVMRAGASRKLACGHLRARGVGMGYGYTFGESIGMAEGLQRQTGMAGMFGSSRTMDNPALAGLFSARDAVSASKEGTIGRELAQARLNEMSDAAAGQSMTISRKTGRGLLEANMRLAQGGIDAGVGGGALSSMFGAMGGNAGAAEKSMRSIENAVFRGTQAGFTDPRTQEELIGAMGAAAQGQVLEGGGGLERLAQFLTLGASGPVSVAQAQARGQAMSGLAAAGQNPYFQGVYAAQAKQILGPNAASGAMQAMVGATPSDLIVGSRDLSNWGVTAGQRMAALKDRIGADVRAGAIAAGIDPEAAMGDPKLREMSLRRSKRYDNDQKAMAASQIFGDVGRMDLSSVTDAQASKALGKYGDAGMKVISTEEAMRSMVTSTEQIKKALEALNPKEYMKMLQEMNNDEIKGANQDLSTAKTYLVKITGVYDDATRPVTGNARRPATGSPANPLTLGK